MEMHNAWSEFRSCWKREQEVGKSKIEGDPENTKDWKEVFQAPVGQGLEKQNEIFSTALAKSSWWQCNRG